MTHNNTIICLNHDTVFRIYSIICVFVTYCSFLYSSVFCFCFFVFAPSAGRLSSRPWWSAHARHDAGNFYKGANSSLLSIISRHNGLQLQTHPTKPRQSSLYPLLSSHFHCPRATMKAFPTHILFSETQP